MTDDRRLRCQLSISLARRPPRIQTLEYLAELAHLGSVGGPVVRALSCARAIVVLLRLAQQTLELRAVHRGARWRRRDAGGVGGCARRDARRSAPVGEQSSQARVQRLVHRDAVLMRDDDALQLGDATALR